MALNIVEEIRSTEKKSKERILTLAAEVIQHKALMEELLRGLALPEVPVRSMCAEIMAVVTQRNPELFPAHGVDELIRSLGDKAPAVKREIAQVIGNIAAVFPNQTGLAVPALLRFTDDAGTVIRWSAAYGLTRIVLANSRLRSGLLRKIRSILENETNNGVKNVYLKGLKKYLEVN